MGLIGTEDTTSSLEVLPTCILETRKDQITTHTSSCHKLHFTLEASSFPRPLLTLNLNHVLTSNAPLTGMHRDCQTTTKSELS